MKPYDFQKKQAVALSGICTMMLIVYIMLNATAFLIV